jgi:2-polyprenyl-6-hydroxyphenyl methylase/3-demethylubiquinone-9 3-methyltransferase
MDWEGQVAARNRFRFGANWKAYLRDVDGVRIAAAEDGLRSLLGESNLAARTFLDVGCGSGLSSLAARNLGAQVRAFDFDPESVQASRELKRRMRPDDGDWTIEQGSVLDARYLAALGTFDVVYSWGVLHHTGAMWRALENVLKLVAPGGLLALAIYNDQGKRSRAALAMKRRYLRSGRLGRAAILLLYAARVAAKGLLVDMRDKRNPVKRFGPRERGMSPWRDMIDWVGGYPFEVAKPEEVLAHVGSHGFELVWMRTVGGGSGNNEYRFARAPSDS